MNSFRRAAAKCFVFLLSSIVFMAYSTAQTTTGSLRGQVMDPSGAAVAGATVIVLPAQGAAITTTTNRDGSYEAKTLLPGKYTVQVFATGFAQFEAKDISVEAGAAAVLNVHLNIEVQKEKVEVSENAATLDTSGASNANSITLTGKDLEALSDDPDEMQDELTALAGPSAGPNGGQIYIDGFTAGQLPPKSSIREIRINQNPFSAEYDQLGYGRIEVLTKPGTDKFHGQFMVHGTSDSFNAKDPFLGAAEQPSYHSILYNGNIGGPLSKKASFFFNIDRRNTNDISIINTPALDSNLEPIQFTQGVENPRTRTNLTPRLDYQLTPSNTLTVRYQYYRENEQNDGIGQSSLPSQAYNSLDTEHTVQISDTQTLGEHVINETRFQYVRSNATQTVLDLTPSINVSGAFTGGGNTLGNLLQTTGGYEIQNYTSIAKGKHFIKFGVRGRIDRDSTDKKLGFNGAFTFDSLTAYQITEQGLAAGETPDQIRVAGGGAVQFTQTVGNSFVQDNYADLGFYVQDEWHIRPSITASYGLRYEWQNQLSNDGGLAPRLGIAWGLGKNKQGTPKAVLRAGFGIFYNRLKQQYIEQALLLNGVTQQSFVVINPDFFPNLPTPAELAAAQTSPTVYQIAPDWKTPYIIQSGITLEKQVTRNANLAFTYLNSRGVHALMTRNINAPLPPTFDPSNRPLGGDDNIYQYDTSGDFKQNQFIVNGNVRMGSKLSLFGYYTLNYARSNTSGVTSFPSDQYDLALDYGRTAFDIRNRLFLGGTISLPYMFRLSPFLVASSGVPFNVTSGVDANNDSVFTDRPTYAQFQAALANAEALGTVRSGVSFDCKPPAGQAEIPIYCGQSPARFALNLRLSKTFGFGKKAQTNAAAGGPQGGGTFGRGPGGPGGGRGNRGGGMFGGGDSSGQRYSLTLAVSARNIFNNVNVGTPIGVITSPIFGQSISLPVGPGSGLYSNRRIELQATFAF
jgi:Carboxypeptidase regulatory-like domain/TonB dependent receptor